MLHQRRYMLNEYVFDIIDEQAAYWLGFLMADGCVWHPPGNRQPCIALELQAGDEAHVQAFRAFLQTTSPLHYRETQNSVWLRVYSTHLAKRLAYFGVVPRKSLIARVCHLEHSRHFWRGVVDGDAKLGWSTCHYQYPVLDLTGARSLLEQYLDFLLCNNVETAASVRPLARANACTVSLTGRPAIQAVYLLYSDCQVALSRKLERAYKIIDEYY